MQLLCTCFINCAYILKYLHVIPSKITLLTHCFHSNIDYILDTSWTQPFKATCSLWLSIVLKH